MGGRRAGNCAERHDHLSFDHVALVMAGNHPGGDARQPIGHTDMKLTSMTRGMSISSLWSCHPCLSWPPTEWSSDTKPPLPISVTLPWLSPHLIGHVIAYLVLRPSLALFPPWTFLATSLKSTCFFIYFSYCMNHSSICYLAMYLTLPPDYKCLRAWAMSYSALKLHLLGHFLLHHSISIG